MEMEKQEKTNNIVVEKFVQTRKKENRDLKKKKLNCCREICGTQNSISPFEVATAVQTQKIVTFLL